jgi:AraC-like DNA-binding protein
LLAVGLGVGLGVLDGAAIVVPVAHAATRSRGSRRGITPRVERTSGHSAVTIVLGLSSTGDAGCRIRNVAATSTLVHASDLVVTSRWVCPADSPLWGETVAVGDCFIVALAHRPVGIRHAGRTGIWADRGGAVLYDPHQPYDRALLHADGDVADIFGFATGVVEEAVGKSFGRSAALVSDRVFLRQRRLFWTAQVDPFEADELALAVLADVAGQLRAEVRTEGRLVERARRELGADLGETLGMAELGRRLHVSPYHLARVFRAGTGSTLHGYREGLRLRTAADRALAGHRLADVAADLGFTSHSHLTHRFRRRFGIVPSALT